MYNKFANVHGERRIYVKIKLFAPIKSFVSGLVELSRLRAKPWEINDTYH